MLKHGPSVRSRAGFKLSRFTINSACKSSRVGRGSGPSLIVPRADNEVARRRLPGMILDGKFSKSIRRNIHF